MPPPLRGAGDSCRPSEADVLGCGTLKAEQCLLCFTRADDDGPRDDGRGGRNGGPSSPVCGEPSPSLPGLRSQMCPDTRRSIKKCKGSIPYGGGACGGGRG